VPVVLRLQFLHALQPFRIDHALINRRTNRTAGFRLVAAIGKAAVRCQLADLAKYIVQRVRCIEQLQLAHAWGIKQPATGWQTVHGPARGCMPALTVRFANVTRGLLRARKRIDQRRLADAG
jgi:hypothetical protein